MKRALPGALFTLFCIGIFSGFATAQKTSEIAEMRTELEQLRAEVSELKSELHQLRSKNNESMDSPAAVQQAAPAPQPDQTPAVSAEAFSVLQAQVSELAQTKVESNSRQPVKLFGTIISGTQFNSGEANWIDIPNLVLARAPGQATGSFSSNLRQSRIGVIVNGPQIGNFTSTGFAAMDFFGGIASFQTAQVLALPRLLYGYVRLEDGKTSLEFGQDQMILAPNNPTSLAAMSFPDLYRSGNLYLRAPQLRIERKLRATDGSNLRLTAGLLAPIGGDFTSPDYLFVPPALGGERSRHPAIQGAVSWEGKSASSDRGWKVGFSGHYNRERILEASIPSWATAFDFDTNFSCFGFGGEWFAGRDIGKFGGSLGQFGKSWGGFSELRYRATGKLEFNAGYGTDRPYDRTKLPVALTHNSSVFANTIYRFVPEIAASLEYKWLGTAPTAAALRQNNNVNLVFAYSF